ncbi:MAG TPA: hypothetical protein VJR02_16860 [Pyrinomonadaceae bacterium]|nr:hypothetical protein [Pyrinomonadaceae bacterium]
MTKPKKTHTGKGRAAKKALKVMGITSVVDAAHVEAELTSSQCVVWRQGEFRKRVREAVADWAQEPVASILPSNTLGELAKGTPWNVGQQANLVQTVNAHDVFAPPFPNTNMRSPSQLVPASTTVALWEKIVWRHQDPETACFPFTD